MLLKVALTTNFSTAVESDKEAGKESYLSQIRRSLSLKHRSSTDSLSSLRSTKNGGKEYLRRIDRKIERVVRESVSRLPLVSIDPQVKSIRPTQPTNGNRNSRFLDDCMSEEFSVPFE